jgi:hypothetical protein
VTDRRVESGSAPDKVLEGRRPYVAPELVEYGTVAKLTQSGGVSGFDFGNMMSMMSCL